MTNKIKVWYFALTLPPKACERFKKDVEGMSDDVKIFINKDKNEWRIYADYCSWYGDLK